MNQLSPMMQQYIEVKNNHKDEVVFSWEFFVLSAMALVNRATDVFNVRGLL